MYIILGSDQQEYGPAGAEVVMQWIREGRAGPNTRVKLAAGADWQPLSAFPEFAAAPASPWAIPPPLSLPPQAGGPDADAMTRRILARDYHVAAGHCVGRGWELVKRNFWLTVGATFVVTLISGVPIAGQLLTHVLNGGLFLLFLKLARGEKTELGEAFAGFHQPFLPLFLAGLVKYVLTTLGFVCCIVPGIYLAAAWSLAGPIIIDKKLDFWPAMEMSRKVVTQHWWQFLGLFLLLGLVLVLGFLCCCVGTIVARPVMFAALAYAYEDIFGTGTPAAPQPV